MSTTGQFSTKNPTIKRILKEASELVASPSADFTASPLEADLFEWHFTLRGPPAPSPFAAGLYHGRIVLPPTYPLRPPSFRFLTPSGRFEVNREICLSISGFHEETWQPAWGIRTALVAIRSFMDTDAGGQVGGLSADVGVRMRLAAESCAWKCGACNPGRTIGALMEEHEKVCQEAGAAVEDKVPEELRLGYKEELGEAKKGKQKEVVEPAGPASDVTIKHVEKKSGLLDRLRDKLPDSSQEKREAEQQGIGDRSVVKKPKLLERLLDKGTSKAVEIAASGAMSMGKENATSGVPRKPLRVPAEMAFRSTRTMGLSTAANAPAPASVPMVDTAWLDKAIIGVAGALALLMLHFLFF